MTDDRDNDMDDEQLADESERRLERPLSDIHLPGRRLGVVSRDATRDRGFLFLKDEAGEEYFAHRSGFVTQAVFDGCVQGDAMSFKAVRRPKGLQAHTIEPATVAERAQTREWAEDLGNR